MKSQITRGQKKRVYDSNECLLENETFDFVTLWDFVQSLPTTIIDQILTPEDILLLNDLINGQNFSIALDLLRHRLQPVLNRLPTEIQDIAKTKTCIRVTPHINENTKVPTLEEFHKSQVGIPPTPSTFVQATDVLKALDDYERHNHVSNVNSTENWTNLHDEQDMDYINSLIADYEKSQTQQISNKEQKKQTELNNQGTKIDSSTTKNDTSTTKITITKEIITESKTVTQICKIPNEPENGGDNVINVVVQVPKIGKRIQRRFLLNNKIEHVIAWASNHLMMNNEEYTISNETQVFTNFPKQEWSRETQLHQCPIERKVLLLMID